MYILTEQELKDVILNLTSLRQLAIELYGSTGYDALYCDDLPELVCTLEDKLRNRGNKRYTYNTGDTIANPRGEVMRVLGVEYKNIYALKVLQSRRAGTVGMKVFYDVLDLVQQGFQTVDKPQ